MFGKMKDVTPPRPGVSATPMISGGMAMMLKSAGLDPAQFEAVVTAMLKDVSDMSERVAVIEKRLDGIETVCRDTQASVQKIEALVAIMTQGVASHE